MILFWDLHLGILKYHGGIVGYDSSSLSAIYTTCHHLSLILPAAYNFFIEVRERKAWVWFGGLSWMSREVLGRSNEGFQLFSRILMKW